MRELAPNQRSIDAVAAASGERTQYRVRGVKGLVLDVTSRSKTWRLRYRLRRGGKRLERSYKIGDAAIIRVGAAIDEAKRLMEQIERQKCDPAHEERERRYGLTRIETFGDLFAGWLQRAKPRLATWADEERRYRLHLQRALGRKSLGEVSRDDIANIRDRLFEDGTPIESNRVVALFNRVMNFGVEERHLGANPGHRLRKLGEERARSRHLNEADLRALWLGLERAPISLSMADALRLLILLGQRRGEVIGARALELRLTGSLPTWTIPDERTKNGHTHLVPLPPMAVEIFTEAIGRGNGSEYVFPSSKTGDAIRPDAVTTALDRTCEALGIAHVSPHDFRRGMGTAMAQMAISREHRALVLNHVDARSNVTSWNYDAHDYVAEKLEALTKWERRVREIVGIDPS